MDNVYAVSRFLLSGSGGQGVITMAILLAEVAILRPGSTRRGHPLGRYPFAQGHPLPQSRTAQRPCGPHRYGVWQIPAADPPRRAVRVRYGSSSSGPPGGSPVQGYTALEHASWAPRLDRFVQHHRPWRPRHADRRGPHRIHRKGTGRAFPLGASRGQQKRPASWGGTGGTPA